MVCSYLGGRGALSVSLLGNIQSVFGAPSASKHTLGSMSSRKKQEEPKRRSCHRLRNAVCLPKDLVYKHQTLPASNFEELSKCFLLFQKSVILIRAQKLDTQCTLH